MDKKKVQQKDIEDGVIIKAEFVRETKLSWLLDCEGDVEWFPKANCNFNAEEQELEAPKWLLRQKFPDEQF